MPVKRRLGVAYSNHNKTRRRLARCVFSAGYEQDDDQTIVVVRAA